ncbi:MAG: B12-binding domain-containing radical SAM protein [Candidatus Rokuibacteriota bacterium]|nr:MAG: B12-binding domain-containing radical SAM protein [Candidatus Rokubacteria bacterium]PYN62847.1 MAG: B12-binding domain-containing radical SAM protein [Candidatus Rokubacteria bacterium]
MRRQLKKLVFVEPKSTHLHIYSRVCIPRLGSVLLATLMRAKGYDVRVYIEDIHPIDMAEVLSADLVAISAITSTAPQSYHLADTVREAGAITVIGGTHTSFLPEEGLQHADFVVRGEGEFAFQELVDAIQAGAGLEKIQNLSYLADGRPVHNPERGKIPNLDVNPIPDYRLITGWKPGGVVSVATSRGCPFSCTFCSVPGMYGHAFRTHSIGRVLEELEVHKGNMYTFFADDIFTANKKRVKELLRGMIQRGLTPEWGAQVRTETVDDPELLQMMRDSNCFNVYVGFESINPRTLKLFNKKQDLAKIERSIERFHAHKIRIHGMFVVGSDEDDLETIDATAEFALKHDIDSVQFMILTPIPGSPDYETLYDHGEKYVISKNWQFYDGHHVVHQPRRLSPYELQIGAISAMEKFYSWRGIAQKLLKRDVYSATIRYWGKKMLREWWKDTENRAHVEWLRGQLYADARELGHGAVRTVGLPALLLQDSVGRLLGRFLGELGVTVVPLAEAAAEGAAKARETLDCLITPIVKRAAKEREEFHASLQAVTETLRTQWEKLPKVSFPLVDGQGPVFEPFAKIGLLFTQNLDRIRDAYRTAGVAEGLWEAA